MKRLLIGVIAASTAMPALAAPVTIKPLLDLRLRWENVDQDGIAKQADAVTLRARAGAQITTGAFTLLGEAEGTAAPVEHYFSGLNRNTQHPLVPDPENIELNRLQLQYRPVKQVAITGGRQRINIEDQRFVGSVGWRQNEQTFDAARVELGSPKGLQADVTYAWSVRTIWGVDGTGPRQQSVKGDNIFATVSYPTPIGKLTGFGIIVDQDATEVAKGTVARFHGSSVLGITTKTCRPGLPSRQPTAYAANRMRERRLGPGARQARATPAPRTTAPGRTFMTAPPVRSSRAAHRGTPWQSAVAAPKPSMLAYGTASAREVRSVRTTIRPICGGRGPSRD